MTEGSLPDVGQLNAREGVREEKWVALDLRTTKFPPTQTSSVRRATLIQNFEADFIRAMGIISPSAALYAQAVIAGVQQDLPVYRKRDDRTTARDWTKKLPEEQWSCWRSTWRSPSCGRSSGGGWSCTCTSTSPRGIRTGLRGSECCVSRGTIGEQRGRI